LPRSKGVGHKLITSSLYIYIYTHTTEFTQINTYNIAMNNGGILFLINIKLSIINTHVQKNNI